MMAKQLTPEAIDQVLALYRADRTYLEIATTTGMTRNAVSGLVDRARKRGDLAPSQRPKGSAMHRLQTAIATLTPQAPPSAEPAREPPPPAPPPSAPIAMPLPPQTERTGVAAAVLALGPSHCRWPIGDTSDPGFSFCCATVVDDPGPMASMRRRYCATHLVAAVAQPGQNRRFR